MAFKTDTSFLKFLTMGAVGVRTVLDTMSALGFEPIELERYCRSNKIWSTKVKRLRLPDILCVRTGVRVEVRAKSDLKLRMSDAPDNPDRRWDVGLRDSDLVAFVPCVSDDGHIAARGTPTFFTTEDLRISVNSTRLGPPKSASEGAERDREWPSTVPSSDGTVLSVTEDKITTILSSGRRQTYQLRGKQAYVSPGEKFIGGVTVIASTVPRKAQLTAVRSHNWSCRADLQAADAIDRYAAAKSVPFCSDARSWGEKALQDAFAQETDDRVALELCASAARIGSQFGLNHIRSVIWEHERVDLRMEAVLIMAELGTPAAARVLVDVANSSSFYGSEIRQAAVWGLGKTGCASYHDLVKFVADEDEEVALHAIGAFGSDTPNDIIEELVDLLVEAPPRERAAASAVLRIINTDAAIDRVVRKIKSTGEDDTWLLATLGRFPASMVRQFVSDGEVKKRIAPLLALGPEQNWIAQGSVANDLDFLLMQNL